MRNWRARNVTLKSVAPVLVVALVSITTARAADLGSEPPSPMRAVPMLDWTGLRIGLSAGYAFDGNDAGYSYNNVPPEQLDILPNSTSLTNNSGLVGGSVGYDLQMSGVVVGIEGDISWTNFGDDDTIVFNGNSAIGMPPITFKTKYDLDWISTLRGRIGVPFGDFLIYGTGGLAFGKVSMNTSVAVGEPPMGNLLGSTEKTKSGWTLGGGAELALTDHVMVNAEALYFDLGNISLNAAAPGFTTATLDVDQKVEGVIARAGISYKF
jgi:outer membrane immunogenic protein